MVLTWLLNEHLQQKFDLSSKSGRLGLRQWCKKTARLDRSLLQRVRLFSDELLACFSSGQKQETLNSFGANLVGYGRGVLGMGEHVRMVGRAMQSAGLSHGIVDFTPGLGNRIGSQDKTLVWQDGYRRACNILHINADQMSRAFWHIGAAAFRDHYSIGYWAWELSKFPEEWRAAIGFVDELWAPSEFIAGCLAEQTKKPVIHMPLCVDLPEFAALPRSQFDLADDEFVYFFAFDCHSFITRKNPEAIIKAFRKAFPANERVRLVIKAMNADVCKPDWESVLSLAAGERRISLINEAWPRERLLSLLAASDCYVSLHRCEGFGRGPAEAMLVGKPVIATDYSGTQDYCNADNALLVQNRLVSVPVGHYPGAQGQVWAEPDVEQASLHMRAVFNDRNLAHRLGIAGQSTIKTNFSPEAIGKRYEARLRELGMLEGTDNL